MLNQNAYLKTNTKRKIIRVYLADIVMFTSITNQISGINHRRHNMKDHL